MAISRQLLPHACDLHHVPLPSERLPCEVLLIILEREARNPVNKIILVVIMMFSSAYAWPASDTNPAEYTVNIHVTASRVAIEMPLGHAWQYQVLNVVIEGKKYELKCKSTNGVLALGDYKAKLIHDQHKTAYDSSQTYEFLLPDKKLRQFEVTGQTE